jgi:formate-dependent nitrite reductase membrane component NrfD
MNLFVTDPHWGWWIILYFFLGGIAAGAYFMATLIDLAGRPEDRGLSRLGYALAFPLIVLCGLFLIVDLDRPERFWHMLFRSETVHEAVQEGWPWTGRSWQQLGRAPLLKYWSPMSIGSWAVALFGLCCGLSLWGSLRPEGRLSRRLGGGLMGRGLQFLGCSVGFFVAAYTGALLTATNQPLWSDSAWIAPLFLTSAASTGIAAMILLAHARRAMPAEALHRLERTDLWVLALELLVFVAFLISLWNFWTLLSSTWRGALLVLGVPLCSALVPLGILGRQRWPQPRRALTAAAFALLGGFLLRYTLLTTPPELLARGPAAFPIYGAGEPGTAGRGPGILSRFSPEDGRMPGSGPGADPGNRPAHVLPRSKVFQEP